MQLRLAHRRLIVACAIALALHFIVLAFLPGVPFLSIPNYDAGRSLLVTLQLEDDPEPLEQQLNLPLPAPEASVAERSLSLANKQQGDDDLPSEAQDTTALPQQAGDSSQQTGKPAPSGFVLRYSDIVRFTQQLARERAEAKPEEVARFVRSFRLDPSPLLNTQTVSYRSRGGDLFVEDRSGSGDICFVQRAGTQSDDFSGQYVQFYRCDREPQRISLSRDESG